jgi:hypothetical protein
MNSQAQDPEHDNKIENRLLSAALDYAAQGWPVFPVWWVENGRCACGKADCQHPGKHPIGRLAPKGRNSATTDPETIRRWWHQYPHANVAIATGPESGLVVVDVDPRHGGYPDRLTGKLPVTPTVSTGGRGWHFYLAHPEGGIKFPAKIPNCRGADLKADGGYVMAPPSVHVLGRMYCWQIPTTHPLAPCPPWLLDVARRPESRQAAPPHTAHGGAMGTAYGRAALQNELVRLAQTPEGDRNNALNRAGFCLGRLVVAGHLEEDSVVSLLLLIGTNVGLKEREIRATVRSGFQAGKGVGHVG